MEVAKVIMVDQHESEEDEEEQIDLDGDNDIEDMMDDEDATEDDGYRRGGDEYREQDPAGDDGYRRIRDEYEEQDPVGDDGYSRIRDEYEVQDPADNNGYRRTRGEYREQELDHGFEDEEHDKVSEPDEAVDASGSMKQEEKPVDSKNEVDIEEHAELLSQPPHGSEVFVGGLPRDATEEDLRELCEQFGEIFEVKLVKDKEKRESKGFAFITFTTKDAAQKSIEEIQDKEFKGRILRCSLSQVKNRLFVGNVPKHLTEEELRKILEESGPGLENIECFKDQQNPSRNRGFLFVEFYNHACAEYAKQKMSSGKFKIDGSIPTITWADPKNAAEASQVKAIYVKNLPESVTSEKLKALFERYGQVTKVVLPPSKTGQTKRDFGYIHFAERSSALKAVKGTEEYEIDGQVIEVALAKPQTDRKSDHGSNAYKAGPRQNYPHYPSYGYPGGDPYGAYNARYGEAGPGQPVIYGRGTMPTGMRMVPMVLPDGRIGYVLQQPGAQAPPPLPTSSRRNERGAGSSDRSSRDSRDSDRSHGRRYRPY